MNFFHTQRNLFKICDQSKFSSGFHDSDIYLSIIKGSTKNKNGFMFKGTDEKYYLNTLYNQGFSPFIPTYKVTLTRTEKTKIVSTGVETEYSPSFTYYLIQGMHEFNGKPQFYIDRNGTDSKAPLVFFNTDDKWTFGIPIFCRKYINNTKNDLFKWNPEWSKTSSESYRYFSSSGQEDVSVYSMLPYKGIWTKSGSIDGEYSLNYSTSDKIINRYYYSDPTDPSSRVKDYIYTYTPWTLEIEEFDLTDFKNLPSVIGKFQHDVYSCDTLYGIYTNIDDPNDHLPIGSPSYQITFENNPVTYDLKNVINNDVEKYDYIDPYYVGACADSISGEPWKWVYDKFPPYKFYLKHDYEDVDGWYVNGSFTGLTGVLTGTYGHYDGWSWEGETSLSGHAYITLSGYTQPSLSDMVMNYNDVVYSQVSGDYSSFTPSASANLTDCNYASYLNDQIAKQFIRYKLPYISIDTFYDFPDVYDFNKRINLNGVPKNWNLKIKDDMFTNYTNLIVNSYTSRTGIVNWKGGPALSFSHTTDSATCSWEPVDTMRTLSGWAVIDEQNYLFPIHSTMVNTSGERGMYNKMVDKLEDIKIKVHEHFYSNFDLNGITVRNVANFASLGPFDGSGTSISNARADAQSTSNNFPLRQYGWRNYITNLVENSGSGSSWGCTMNGECNLSIFPNTFAMFGLGDEKQVEWLSFVSVNAFKTFSSFGQGEVEDKSFNNSDGKFTNDSTDCFFGFAYPLNSSSDGIPDHLPILDGSGEDDYGCYIVGINGNNSQYVNYAKCNFPVFVTSGDITDLTSTIT